MSLFCRAVVYLLVALPAVAHPQAFVAITIKPARSADPRNARLQVLPNGDLIASAVPVITLLSYAYDVPVDPSPRLSALPDWTIRERYDIEGKAIGEASAPKQGAGAGALGCRIRTIKLRYAVPGGTAVSGMQRLLAPEERQSALHLPAAGKYGPPGGEHGEVLEKSLWSRAVLSSFVLRYE